MGELSDAFGLVKKAFSETWTIYTNRKKKERSKKIIDDYISISKYKEALYILSGILNHDNKLIDEKFIYTNEKLHDYEKAYFINRKLECELLTGDYENCIETCNIFIDQFFSEPLIFKIINMKGVAYSKLNKQNEAIEAFEQRIKINSNYDVSWFNKAYSYYILNQQEKALESLEKCLKINCNNNEAINLQKTILRKI